MRARRSCLSVPGSSRRMLAKAPGLRADEVVIDPEDAVAASAKDKARAAVVSALASGQLDGRTVAVRVNGLDTPWCHRDIVASADGPAAGAVTSLVVPKVQAPEDIEWVARLLDAMGTGARAIRFEALIETAAGLRDFAVGQVFDDAPALTLGAGHAALHQAIAGDRLRLALDDPLCRRVTGGDRLLAHPSLVCDVAIGQSTGPTQRVRGNLFYRGLVLQRPVFLGNTQGTRTEVVALKQNRPREDAPATGLVVLRIRTTDQDDQPVLDFWRSPMLPLRDPDLRTGHADALDAIPAELNRAAARAATPAGWRLDALRARAGADGGLVDRGRWCLHIARMMRRRPSWTGASWRWWPERVVRGGSR